MNIVRFQQRSTKLWTAFILLCVLVMNFGLVASAEAMATQAEMNEPPQKRVIQEIVPPAPEELADQKDPTDYKAGEILVKFKQGTLVGLRH